MKIGTRGHYSVIAMVELARQTYLDKPVSLSRIADRQLIPLNYLEQLFVELKKANLVRGVRGAFGGYILAKAASKITVWDILKGSGECTRLNQCSGDKEKPFCMGRTSCCGVHALWENLTLKIESHLETVTLADLMEPPSQMKEDTLNFYAKHTTSLDKNSAEEPKDTIDSNDPSACPKKRIHISRP